MRDRIELSLLLDYYGAFLTENQRELIELSCDDDYSLSEIAEQKGISRQGVRDAITRGEKTLRQMEDSLHLVERDRKMLAIITALRNELSADAEPLSGEKRRGILMRLTLLADMMEGKDGV